MTDRRFASRAGAPFGDHASDQFCTGLGIEHRLTPPKSPRTTALAGRFAGRLSDVLTVNGLDNGLDLERTLMRCVHLYNTQLPQAAFRV